jgi:hypothetical protein
VGTQPPFYGGFFMPKKSMFTMVSADFVIFCFLLIYPLFLFFCYPIVPRVEHDIFFSYL